MPTLPGPPPRRTRVGSRLGCSKEGVGSARLVPRPTLPGKQEILAPRLSLNFSSRWVRSVDYALTTTHERSVAHLCAPAQSVGFPRLVRIGWCARPWLPCGARPPAHPPRRVLRVLWSLPPRQLVGKKWSGFVVRIGRGNLDSH